MPRAKRNKHVAILDYFKTADLAQAELMLSLVQEAVALRQPPKVVKAQTRKKKLVPVVAAEA